MPDSAPEQPAGTSSPYGALPWAALGVGLALRLVGRALGHYSDIDGDSYLALIGELAAGRGLEATGVRYWPPVFPGLSALVAWVSGLSPFAAAGVVTVASSTLLVLPAWALGRSLGGARAASWAAWGAALLPPLVLTAHRTHAEAPGLLLLAGAMALVLATGRPHWRGAGAGLLLGLAFLTRFELVLGLPALVLGLALAPSRRAGLAGLALGLAAILLPWQGLLLYLGEGWLIPDTRLASNLAETMSAGALGFGFDQPGTLGQEGIEVAAANDVVTDRVVELARALAQLPRAVPASLAVLAGLGARAVGWRRGLPVLLLGLPCLASAIAVDHESRYWLTLTVALLPLAAVGLWRLPQFAWPLVALGLLSWPRAFFPDGPLPVLGPGESLLGTLLEPGTTLLAAEGLLLLVVRPLLLLVALACGLAMARRARERPLRLGLVAAALLASLLVMHLEHARASMPSRPLAANLELAFRLDPSRHLACARALDAHVADATFVPPPRADLSPTEVEHYLHRREVSHVLLDAADPRAAALQAWAAPALVDGRLLIEVQTRGLILARVVR